MVKAELLRKLNLVLKIVYSDAVALAHNVGIEVFYPRIARYQLHQLCTPAANASHYYQRTITIQTLHAPFYN